MYEQSYRDPVHDFITLKERLFKQLVDTKEFQRLRRIRQLGLAYGTYHGAEHTRFGHSLGVLWIMTKVIQRLQAIGIHIDDEVAVIARAAALLHDLGHGPFSHALEGFLSPGKDHESWTKRVLLEQTDVNRVLRKHSSALPEQVAAVIDGTFSARPFSGPAYISDLVSSQLDVDRMDYLLRDSYYAGVTYGRFDLQRVVNTMYVHNNRLVTMGKGMVALEEYLLARYLMYWQVYLHKSIRSQDALLTLMWQRALDLCRLDAQSSVTIDLPRSLTNIIVAGSRGEVTEGAMSLDDYLNVDDHDLFVAAKTWLNSDDEILSDLADRFVNRKLFKAVFRQLPTTVSNESIEEAMDVVSKKGYDPTYYFVVDDVRRSAYDPYTPRGNGKSGSGEITPVLIMGEDGAPREITEQSETVRSLASKPGTAVNIFVPESVIAEVRAVFGTVSRHSY